MTDTPVSNVVNEQAPSLTQNEAAPVGEEQEVRVPKAAALAADILPPPPEPEQPKEEESTKSEEGDEESSPATVILSLLKEFKDPPPPSQAQIEQWKTKFGAVYVIGLTDEELVIFRPILRSEFVEMQTALAQGRLDPAKQEDYLVQTCVLWSSFNYDVNSKAGITSTVAQQIMFRSCFYDDMSARTLVAQL